MENPNITQSEIVKTHGLSQSTVSRKLTTLRTKGLIQMNFQEEKIRYELVTNKKIREEYR